MKMMLFNVYLLTSQNVLIDIIWTGLYISLVASYIMLFQIIQLENNGITMQLISLYSIQNPET